MDISIWDYKSTVFLSVYENLADDARHIVWVIEEFEIRIKSLKPFVMILRSELL